MTNSAKPYSTGKTPDATGDAGVAEQRRHFEREALARMINTSREDADESATTPDLSTGNKNRVGETA